MGCFSFLAFSSSALYMAQKPLTVLSLTGQLFDPNFFEAAVGSLMVFAGRYRSYTSVVI